MTKPPMNEELQLLRAADLARLLSVDVRSVWRLLAAGVLPAPIRLGARTVRWKAGEIAAAIERVGGAR